MSANAKDVPSAHASIWIDEPTDVVWNVVADIANLGRFSPETVRTEWLPGSEPHTVGARFRGFNNNGSAEWHTDCEITDYTPFELFGFSVGAQDNQYATLWRYGFAAERDGTRLTESYESPLLLTPPAGMNPVRHEVMADMLAATLAAIKADFHAH